MLWVPGACWGGFHGRGSGQPQIASQAPTGSVCGDKQGWPRGGAGERLGMVGQRPGAAGHRPRGHSRPLTQPHVFQTNTRPCTELGKAPCPGPHCLGRKPRPWRSLGGGLAKLKEQEQGGDRR